MNNSPLFIKQLKALITTLEKTQQAQLCMSTWYHESETTRSMNSCGYAACLCGDLAFNADYETLKHFPRAASKYSKEAHVLDSNNSYLISSFYRGLAKFIAGDLEAACYRLTRSIDCARALHEPHSHTRRKLAFETGMFTSDELLGHHHMTNEKPTIEQAIQFIELMISKLEKHYK